MHKLQAWRIREQDLVGSDPKNWRYKRAYLGAQDDPEMREFYLLQVCAFLVDFGFSMMFMK